MGGFRKVPCIAIHAAEAACRATRRGGAGMPLISLLQRAVHSSCHLEGMHWLPFSPTLPQSAGMCVCVLGVGGMMGTMFVY